MAPKSKMDLEFFACFPKLPMEIRLNIWKTYAMLEPRIVEICLKKNEERRYGQRNVIHHFYSPTPLPQALFNINRECRSVALSLYILSFSNDNHPARIRWNPAIDTIFLSNWCFKNNVYDFKNIKSEEKALIQRLAIEILIWHSDWEEGSINSYVQIDEYRNLRQVILAHRLPDDTRCGCCHQFKDPEEGVVGFRATGLRGKNDAGAEYPEERGSGKDKEDRSDEDDEAEAEVGDRSGRKTMSEECMETFIAIHERDPGWRIPTVMEMDLKRGRVCI